MCEVYKNLFSPDHFLHQKKRCNCSKFPCCKKGGQIESAVKTALPELKKNTYAKSIQELKSWGKEKENFMFFFYKGNAEEHSYFVKKRLQPKFLFASVGSHTSNYRSSDKKLVCIREFALNCVANKLCHNHIHKIKVLIDDASFPSRFNQ